VKLTSGIGIVLSQQHYFRAQNYERYGTQIWYIRENVTSIQTKNKSHHCCEMFVEAMMMAENHSVRLRVAVEMWMRSCFLKHAKSNKRTILIYKVHSRCVVNRNK